MKQYIAERFRRYEAASQPELDFGPAPAQEVSPIDHEVAQAMWARDSGTLDLTSIEDPAKRKRMRELLRPGGMKRRCGDASEDPLNDNGTHTLL
jgi:hypothetical protein